MSDTITLRDHSQPCEHPPHKEFREVEGMFDGGYTIEYGAHLFFNQPTLPDYWVCGDDDCPGGRERTFREEWRCRKPDYQRWAVFWCGPDGKHQDGEWGCGYVWVEVSDE